MEKHEESCIIHTADVVLLSVREGRLVILLEEKGNGEWALPGEMIQFDEDMDETVMRQLSTFVTSSEDLYFRQLYTLGRALRVKEKRVITTAYLTLTAFENVRVQDPKYQWFSLSKTTTKISDEGRQSILSLSKGSETMRYVVEDTALHNYIRTTSRVLHESTLTLALDHIKLINIAMDQVQHRAASTGILFNLLPEEFSLREIQTAYEAVIGHTTDTPNFRRDIRRMLRETGRKKRLNGRSVSLFTFNPMYAYLKENL